MSTIQFTKAARHAVKLKVAVDGPSGSGKTMGALALAYGITQGGRIAVADSENGSASLYSDRYDFDTVTVDDPRPETYIAIIDAAAQAGYQALVIDSLTHCWQYLLSAKEDYDRANPKSNQWTNWGRFTPRWEALMRHILNAPIHVIATMRSKQAYEQVENNGRKQIVKLGLQPQVRDGAEYEFGIVFSVNIAHHAEATKDRTGLFSSQMLDLCSPTLHADLVRWMNAGGPAPAVAPSVEVKAWEAFKVGDRRMDELSDDELSRYIDARSGEPKYVARVIAAQALLDHRKTNRSPDDAVARMTAAVEAETADLPF